MPLFGKKKEKDVEEILKEIPKETPELEEPSEKEIKEEKKTEIKERPSFAPLFVKIDRYKHILNTMNYLKTTLVMLKNSIAVLNELDKIRQDNLNLIEETMGRVEKRVLELDSEFMRPSGFHEEAPEYQDVKTLEATISDLRNQIDQLKEELETIG